MENHFDEEYLKLYVEFMEKREFIFIPADSEMFQLKMMICAKFRLYEYNKLIILNRGNIISSHDDREKIFQFLIPENQSSKEYLLLVIYEPEMNNFNHSYQNVNNSFTNNKSLNESYNYNVNSNTNIHNFNNNSSGINLNGNNSINLNNTSNKQLLNMNLNNSNNKTNVNNITLNTSNNNVNLNNSKNNNVLEYNSNSISDPNSLINKNSTNTLSASNVNLNLNNSNLNNLENSLVLNEKSLLNESNFKCYVICGCSEGNEALHICLKCNCFVCGKCIKQEPHLMHPTEIIKISQALEFMKKFINEQSKKLEDEIVTDENYIYVSNFENFFSDFKIAIEKNYDHMLKMIEDIKEKEMDYLIFFNEKISINEKYIDLNNEILNLINELEKFNEEDRNIKNHINFRKALLKKYELVNVKHNLLKQYYSCFLNSVGELEFFNDKIIKRFEKRFTASEVLFKAENIQKKLKNIILSKFNS